MRFSQEHRGVFITTAWVLVEVADAWATSPYRNRAGQLVQALPLNSRFRVVPPAKPLLDRAIQLYLDRPDKEWSLTDCISFLVMEDEGLTEALTGDHHFEQAGFSILVK